MLLQLNIMNFALIEKLSIDFLMDLTCFQEKLEQVNPY